MNFLQGELTFKNEFSVMIEKLSNGMECSVELINYKSSGQSFNNYLQMIPLRDGHEITHYLGILEDVSRSSEESKGTDELKKDNELEKEAPSRSDQSTHQDHWIKKREDLVSFLKSSHPLSSTGTYVYVFTCTVYLHMCPCTYIYTHIYIYIITYFCIHIYRCYPS
jgi:hypothetical protein